MNLSVIAFTIIYLVIAIIHLIFNNYNLTEHLTDQLSLLLVMLPFLLIGLALDYILGKNQTMEQWIVVITKLLPAGVFVIQVISSIYLLLDKAPTTLFNQLIWLFLALPFFIVSYDKETFRQRLRPSLIGTIVLAVVYLFLTMQTKELDGGTGAVILLASYFCLLYASSGIKKLPYLGMLLGILNALLLLVFRYIPLTEGARLYGWDYDILRNFECLIIATLVFSVVIRSCEAAKLRSQSIQQD